MPSKTIITENDAKMKKSVDSLQNSLKSLRTGRASTGLVENIKVEYYGTPTPIKQIANLATPQADMVVIKPFDPASAKEIERAIKNSDLSISPVMDGKLIRLTIPSLSEERRNQIVTQAKQLGEQAKVSIRSIRRDAIKQLEKAQKDKTITEDDLEKGKKQLDELTKTHTAQTDHLVKSKSDEIMQD